MQELKKQLEDQDKLDQRSLESLTSTLTQHTLRHCEESDITEYHTRVQDWETERQMLIQRETEMRPVAAAAQ